MPITPFLKGQSFDPEATRAMGLAFENACRSLGLAGRADAATEVVARKIIELAQRGERDADVLHSRALEELDLQA